jgi:hypothetical protein
MARPTRYVSHAAAAKRAVSAELTRGLVLATEFLLTEANKHVPHDEGVLERSGEASNEGHLGAVSYDTPYAVRQHEDTTLRHYGKGEAKWLENTFTRDGRKAADIIATQARKATT